MLNFLQNRLNGIVLGLLFVLLLLFSFRQIYSPDLGFHLAAGRWIIENRAFPDVDPFSYASLGQYVDIYWIFQLSFWLVYQVAKEPALVLWNALLVLAAFGILALRLRLGFGKINLLQLVLLMLSVLAIVPVLEIRPHSYSWIYFNLTLLILEQQLRHGYQKTLWCLVPLMVLWVNTHSMFILGIVLIAVHSLCTWLESGKADLRLMIVLFFAFAACFLNPYFDRGIFFSLDLFEKIQDQNIYSGTISELQSLFAFDSYITGGRFVLLNQFFFLQLLFVVFAMGFCLYRKQLRLHEIFLFVIFSYLFFSATKNVGYFAFAVLPMAFKGLEQPCGLLYSRLSTKYSRDEIGTLRLSLQAMMIFVMLHLAKTVVTDEYYFAKSMPYRFGYRFDNLQLPHKAVEFLQQKGLQGQILNPLRFGGFLELMTSQKVYVDGRLEVMTEPVYREYLLSQQNPAVFDLILKKYGAQIVMLDYEQQEVWQQYLVASADWRLVYFDEGAAIFLKRDYAMSVPTLDVRNQLLMDDFLKEFSQVQNTLKKTSSKSFFAKANSAEAERRLSVFHYKNGNLQQAIYWGLKAVRDATQYFPVLYYNLGSYFYHAKLHTLARLAYENSGKYRENLVVQMRLKEMAAVP